MTSGPEPPAAVERWFARARPWASPRALAAAGRDPLRAAADDSAERHSWCAVLAEASDRCRDAAAELRAALGRDPTFAAPAAAALARVQARAPTPDPPPAAATRPP